MRHQLTSVQTGLSGQVEKLTEENKQKEGWLDHQQQENDWLRAELEKRPKVTRKTYKVLTLGMKATGKTSLTLKWANPLVDLGTIQGTKIERYERTVSQVVQKDVTTEHVFEVGDWGGEHIVDAQQELIVDEIHGLLIVVDLGGKDAKSVQPERIQEQLREFQPQSLKYFFGPKTVASCKAVVLFINKTDLIPGSPAEAEAQARKLYGRLIDDLNAYQAQVDIRVLVGSASYGHATHHLFSHFVEKILPKNAYDNQLLQRMKSDLASVRGAGPSRPGVPRGM
jgi:GTPase SAR1 family protein